MKGCQHCFLTPLDLINHLLTCDEARKGNVQCGNLKCESSHAMTRLLSPTQLWRRLRRRDPSVYEPRLTPPTGPQSAGTWASNGVAPNPKSKQSYAKSTELEGDTPSEDYFPRHPHELDIANTGMETIYHGQGGHLFSTGGSYGSLAHPTGKPHEMAAIEPTIELDASVPTPAPIPTVSSQTSGQSASRSSSNAFQTTAYPSTSVAAAQQAPEASRTWSGDSRASTLYNNQPDEGLENHLRSKLFDLQHQASFHSNLGFHGSGFSPAKDSWLFDAPFTMSPETSETAVMNPEMLWFFDAPTYAPETCNITEGAHHFPAAPGLEGNGYGTNYTDGNQVASQVDWTNGSDQWRASYAATSETLVFLPPSREDVAQDSPELQEHHDLLAFSPPAYQSVPKSGTRTSASPQLARSNAFRATGPLKPTPTPPSAEGTLVKTTNEEILKCTICGHQPQGQKKNLRSHLKRHEGMHKTERLKCTFRGCKATFQYGREDNRAAHLKRHRQLKVHKDRVLRAAVAARLEVNEQRRVANESASGGDWGRVSEHSVQVAEVLMVQENLDGHRYGDMLIEMVDNPGIGWLDMGNAQDPLFGWLAKEEVVAADVLFFSGLELDV